MNSFPEAIDFYNHCLNYASTPEEIAIALNNLGVSQRKNNSFPQALSSYTEALQIYRELSTKNPDVYLPDVALTLNNLGNVYSNINSFPEALSSYTEALQIRRELAIQNPNAYQPDLAVTLVNLSLFYQNAVSNKQSSLQYATEAIQVIKKCNPTPIVAKYLESAQKIIQYWNNPD